MEPKALLTRGPNAARLLLVGLVALALLKGAQTDGVGSAQIPGVPTSPNNFQVFLSDPNNPGALIRFGTTSLPDPPTHVFKGNFGADSFMDAGVFTCGPGGCGFHLFPGTGNGGFGAPSTFPFPAGMTPSTVAIADFDLSGADDTVVGFPGGQVDLFLNPSFGAPFRTFNCGCGDVRALGTGRLNSDLFPDIAVLGSMGLAVILHSPGAVFTTSSLIPLAGGTDLAVGRANLPNQGGDSFFDLFVSVSTDPGNPGMVSVFTNSGTGTFAAPPSVTMNTAIDPIGVHVSDLTGDNLVDIVTLNRGSGSISIFPANSTGGGFGARTDVNVGANPVDFALSRLNADAFTDIVVGSGDGQLRSLVNFTSPGGTPSFTTVSQACGSMGLVSVSDGDLSGDNRGDIVVGGCHTTVSPTSTATPPPTATLVPPTATATRTPTVATATPTTTTPTATGTTTTPTATEVTPTATQLPTDTPGATETPGTPTVTPSITPTPPRGVGGGRGGGGVVVRLIDDDIRRGDQVPVGPVQPVVSGPGVSVPPIVPPFGPPSVVVETPPIVPVFNVAIEAGINPATASCSLDAPHLGGLMIAENRCLACCTEGDQAALLNTTGFAFGSGAGVYLNSGEFYIHEVDLSIPGRGFNWEFARKYRSGITSDSPLGRNWDFSYNRRLVILNEGNLGSASPGFGEIAPGDVMRVDGVGRVDRYAQSSDGSFTSPAGFFSTLERDPDGLLVERDAAGSATRYGPTDSRGVAQMSAMTDQHGNTMRFEYDAGGRLIRVLDTLGRPISYRYNAQGRLVAVEDFAGRRITFGYDANGDLVSVTSPAVIGTPNGNDFPQGKTTHYAYSSNMADPTLNHNLVAITAPNEVATGGPPRVQVTYDAQDRVTRFTIGGTNASGVPAGGTIGYTYRQPGPGEAGVAVTDVVDRNGNRTSYGFNSLGNITMVREQTRGLRNGEPAFYESRHEYDPDGNLLRTIFPEGNSIEYRYDASNLDRRQQGNRVAEIRWADPARGGDQDFLITTYTYEPIYNQVRSITEPRGNDPSYVPQNGGTWSASRYTTIYTFDYEESCNAGAIGASAGRTAGEVQRLLARAGMCASPLGDVNEDGRTNQVSGQVIRTQRPTVALLPGSNAATVEGGTSQPIVELVSYNSFGQRVSVRDPEGNVDRYDYYPERDPDGDGVIDAPGGDPAAGGYLKQVTRDTASGPERESGTNPPPTNIRHQYTYDAMGNVIQEVDGRGIATRYAVNQLNQVVQITRAAAHNVFTPDPPEPMDLADFSYLERTFYDANNNVVVRQIEDRGNTANVDGNLPAADLPPSAPNPDPTGGTAFVDTVLKYDILDHEIGRVQEVANGTMPESLRTRTRYDPNGNRVLVIAPEANAESFVFDERNLEFQRTRGALAPVPLTLLAASDPRDHNIRGGLPSTERSDYDGNRNLVAWVDADGDQTRYVYDGFDRRTSEVDAVGNQTVTQYDPAGKAVRQARFGATGRAGSAVQNLTSPLHRPVSSAGVIRVSNLLSADLLEATETRYDELGRDLQMDRVLFVNSTPTQRPSDLADGAADLGKGNLNPGATQAIPGVPDITVLGRVSTRTEYDRNSRATFLVQDDGDTTRTRYDGAGRMRETIDPAGNAIEFAYDGNGNLIETRETDVSQVPGVPAEQFLTTRFYDSLNRLQRQVDNLGQTTERRYDSRNNLVAAADAQGPPGPAISRRAFVGGALTRNTTNLSGNVTLYFYDGVNRKTREERILTASGEGDGVNIGNDIFGVRTTPPTPDPAQGGGDGIVREGTVWDGNALPSARLDDQGNVTLYLYDNLNRRVAESQGLIVNTSPLDGSHVLGARQILAPTGGTINNPAAIAPAKVDAQLASTKLRLNRLAPLFPALADRIDDRPPTARVYGYDGDHNLLFVEDENGSETFVRYDAINRPIAVRVFRAGQADSHTGDPIFAPRPRGNLPRTRGTLPPVVGTTKQDFQWDGLSRMIRATDNNDPEKADDDSSLTLSYDSLSRVVEEGQQIGGGPIRAVSSAWRAENLRSGLTYPNGRRLDHTYDHLDRLRTVTDQGSAQPVADYAYIGPGRVLERHYPQNGTRMTYLDDARASDVGYDGLRRPVEIRHVRASGSLVAGFSSVYDRMNNKRTEGKLHDPANDESYIYDSLYRLIRFDRPQPEAVEPLQRNWTLDGVGNWISVDSEPRQHSSSNEIIQRGAMAILSDDNGNEYDNGAYAFRWDFANRLRVASRKSDGSRLAVYTYDALGRRIRKVVTNAGTLDGTTDFYLDGLQEIEEHDGTGGLLRQYVYGRYVDEPLVLDRNLDNNASATDPADQRLFYHQNSMYSVFALTNAAGDVTESYQYDAYGHLTISGPGMAAYAFTGRRLDAETGLYFYRARYLDSEQGRFLTRDPEGYTTWLPGLYQYASNSPTQRVDPYGLQDVAAVTAGSTTAASAPSARTMVGCCGPDVTAQLVGVLKTVIEDFNKLSVLDQMGQGVGMGLWNIDPLRDNLRRIMPAGCGVPSACADTVMIYGQCHRAGIVNYALYGVIESLLPAGRYYGAVLHGLYWLGKKVAGTASLGYLPGTTLRIGVQEGFWVTVGKAYADKGESIIREVNMSAQVNRVQGEPCARCPSPPNRYSWRYTWMPAYPNESSRY